MNQNNYGVLITRIREHCQQTARDAKPGAGWADRGKDYVRWYVPERKSCIVLKQESNGQKPTFAFSSATRQQILETEQQLGFPLPPLLRLLYTQVANGGFGPGYGIIGARSGYPCIDCPYGDIAQRYHWEIDFANALIQKARGGWRSLTPEARQVLWDDGIGSQELWEAGQLSGMDQEEKAEPRAELNNKRDPEREITWRSPWPERLLPFCEHGCNIVTYIYADSGEVFQGMRGPDLFVSASLEEWLERWLAGEELQFM